MATSSLSTLAVAFSSLSFSSCASSCPHTLFLPPIRFRRTALRLRSNRLAPKVDSSSSSLADEISDEAEVADVSDDAEVANISDDAEVAEDYLNGMTIEKYVKSRLPGGIAAQRIIGTGYRKTSIARVVLQEGTGKAFINYRDAKEYLQGNPFYLENIKLPLLTLGFENSYDLFVKVHGGGLSGQSQAICLGVARALVKVSEDFKPTLRKEGLITRDIRIVEPKKTGLKKARKRPQYSKR